MDDKELINEVLKRAEEHQKQKEKEFAMKELEKIKEEIITKHCNKCDVEYDINKCYKDNLDGWCEVFDNIKIIDNHIAELKGE